MAQHDALEAFLDLAAAHITDQALYAVAEFSSEGLLHNISVLTRAARDAEAARIPFYDLAAALVAHPDMLLRLKDIAPEGVSLLVRHGAIVVLDRDLAHGSIPLAGRCLHASSVSEMTSVFPILEPLAATMDPGTEVVVFDTTMSRHQRMEILRYVPDFEALKPVLLAQGCDIHPPLRLVRLPHLAVLVDRHHYIAWIRVPEPVLS